MRKKFAKLVIVATGALAFASAASAATIVSGSTQTGNGGFGDSDPDWTVSFEGSVPAEAKITDKKGGWADPIPGTKWIEGAPTGTAAVGLYTFTNVFTLSNVGNVQSLIVSWLADNTVLSIKLNSVLIYGPFDQTEDQGNFNGPIIEKPFDLNGEDSARLKNGENKMEWLLYNRKAGNNNNAGLSAKTIISSVPEPGTWMLMILGLGAVGFAMRRRNSVSVRMQFS